MTLYKLSQSKFLFYFFITKILKTVQDRSEKIKPRLLCYNYCSYRTETFPKAFSLKIEMIFSHYIIPHTLYQINTMLF